MREMEERVARAIWDAGVAPLEDGKQALAVARAAIAAMLEPTYTMVRAAETEADNNLFVCPTVGWECVTLIYQAMIREAMRNG